MATFNVTNSAQLATALNQASGGDKIVLASGDYGRLDINEKFSSTVTITSADAGHPAKFSSMLMNGAQNVTIDKVSFDYTYKTTDSATYKPFEVANSSKIVIHGSVFDGDVKSGGGTIFDGYGTGVGLSVRGSSSVQLAGNEFKGWGTALKVNDSQNIQVQTNDIHDIRRDGSNFVNVQGVVIENNHIHDFKGLPDGIDHRDMIQFWTTGTNTPSTNITIRGNLLDIGQGSHTQSIFMRNDVVDKGLGGKEMFYQNVLIENNTIINHHLHGITVGETEGLTIRGNTLTAAVPDPTESTTKWLLDKYGSNSGILIPRIDANDASHHVNITGNTFFGGSHFTGPRTDSSTGHGSDWSVTGNVSHPTDAGMHPGTGTNTGGGGTGGGTGGNGSGGGGTGGGTGGTGGGTGGGVVTHAPILDDYVAKFASMVASTALKGNAFVQNGALHLDGKGDYVNLGHPDKLGTADDLSFSIDYSRDVANGSQSNLVWNQSKIGLVLKGDGLFIKVAGDDGKFKLFSSGNLGLNDTDDHNIRVIVDSDSDHLQVIVDGRIAIDSSDIGLDLGRVTGNDWLVGGNKWGTGLDGEISGFHLEADAQFHDQVVDAWHHDMA